MKTPVTIIMIEDDEGHARLIERNIRRSDVANEIIPFCNGTEAVRYLFGRDGSGSERDGQALDLEAAGEPEISPFLLWSSRR